MPFIIIYNVIHDIMQQVRWVQMAMLVLRYINNMMYIVYIYHMYVYIFENVKISLSLTVSIPTATTCSLRISMCDL